MLITQLVLTMCFLYQAEVVTISKILPGKYNPDW